jgi:SAM-dependent methyltransferase
MKTISQREIWVRGLGDAWLKENREILGKYDFVSEVMERAQITPKVLLEIGCSNGWRLKKLRDKYGCVVCGIDPSPTAIAEAVGAGLDRNHVVLGTADRISAAPESFDVVIFGWCLCFIAPEDWSNVAAETARVLKDGGYIIVDDFIGSRPMRIEHKNINAEDTAPAKAYIYHFDWPSMWTWHPGYKIYHEAFFRGRGEACTVIRKDVSMVFANEHTKA